MSRLWLAGRIAVFVLVFVARPLTADEKTSAEREKNSLRQRREALQAAVEVRRKEYEAGRGTAADLLRAARPLFLAELELADKPADRLALCDRLAPVVKEAAEGIEALYKAGRLTEPEYAVGRAACRDDEVTLARQRLKARPSPQGEQELRKLLLARHEAYQAALKVLQTEIEAGRASHQLLLDTYRRALRAEEESTDKPAEHFRMLAEAHDRLKGLEEAAKKQLDDGNLDRADYAAVRIARLSVALDQARAQLRNPDRSPRVKKLLTERRDAARELMEVRRLQMEAGKSTPRELLDAVEIVLEAELPLAETRPDRLAVLRARLEGLKQAEEVDKARFEVGRISPADYQTMRAARLAAEIDLLRAERAAK
jgi:hypothetical protein